MTVFVIFLALGAATCYALSSALEQRAAKQERPYRSFDPRLLIRLVRRPLWLAGWAPDVGGTVLQAIALHWGALALVEPLLVSNLLLAIPLEAALNHHRPHRRDFVAVLLSVAGLAGFLIAADPRLGVSNPSPSRWIAVAAGAVVVVLVCLLLARTSSGSRRGTLLGIATGSLYALAAALLKSIAGQLADHPLQVFMNWQLYALLLVGSCAMVLNQNAFQAGALAAPLSALTLLDPLGSVVIGVTAFQERINTSWPHIVIEVVAILAMSRGIWMASQTHPIVMQPQDEPKR